MSSDQVNGFHDPTGNQDAISREEHPAAPTPTESTEPAVTVKTIIDGFHLDPENGIHPMVSIKWKDAESQGGPSWEDACEMLEFARKPLILVHTVGQLLHIDEEKIAVTDTISGDQMGGVTKIPRMWIMELTELAPREDAQDSPLSFTDENANDRNRSVG